MSSLKDLDDVVSTNLNSSADKFVLIFDADQNKMIFVNPDDVIDSAVGISSTRHTPTFSWWDGLLGTLTVQIPNHGFSVGDHIKIADYGITFTCDQDSHATNHPYPRPTDFASDRWLTITQTQTNTFRVQATDTIPSTNVGVHTFVSAVTNSVYHTSDPTPIGLTTATIDYLDTALDDKIDLDAGTF